MTEIHVIKIHCTRNRVSLSEREDKRERQEREREARERECLVLSAFVWNGGTGQGRAKA